MWVTRYYYSLKTKSRWLGPFVVTDVKPHRVVEISKNGGEKFKLNGQRLKFYHEGAFIGLVEE